MSDQEIVEQSVSYTGDLLERGDSVMADRGFNIDDLLTPKGVTLNISPFLEGQPQLARKDIESTRRIAELRIHVERAIRQARRYEMLNSPIPLNIASIADEIVSVCF